MFSKKPPFDVDAQLYIGGYYAFFLIKVHDVPFIAPAFTGFEPQRGTRFSHGIHLFWLWYLLLCNRLYNGW